MRLQVGLTFCLALLSLARPAVTQTSESISATSTPATVAYVYVQVAKGVNVYMAASTGKLTVVKGSPFAVAGQMEGVNGKYLISVGTTIIHSYAIESNGAVGKQVSVANTQNYGGAECGTTSADGNANGATLDHTGKYFYIQLFAGFFADCAAWQTYQVSSNGQLNFLSDIEYYSYSDNWARSSSVPTMSSNDNFAYGVFTQEWAGATFSSFVRTASGILDINQSFTASYPTPNPEGTVNGPWMYSPALFYYPSNEVPYSIQAADPAGHLAVLMESESGGYGGGDGGSVWGPPQLASFRSEAMPSLFGSSNLPVPTID